MEWIAGTASAGLPAGDQPVPGLVVVGLWHDIRSFWVLAVSMVRIGEK
jgi:hypothetical protein